MALSDPSTLLGNFLCPSRLTSKPPPLGSLPGYLKHHLLLPGLRAQGLGHSLPDPRPAGLGHPGWTLAAGWEACCAQASLELALD